MHKRVAGAKTAVSGVALGCLLSVAVFAASTFAQDKPATVVPAPEKSVPAIGGPAVGVMNVKYAAGKFSVKAEKADLPQLLKKISEASGIPVEVGSGVTGTITISFVDLPLEAGINRILETAGEKNLATEYAKKPGSKNDEYKIEKITVVKKADPKLEKEREAAINAAMQRREQEYRELFAKMDKGRNKIARALKEYTDPRTSDDEKRKLRTYLRQTSVDDMEDKKLLKGASLDPKYSPLLSDIQMALLHAIQDHPEESDKEFLLDLLRKKIPPGWLMYAMLKVWDDKYVPFLIDYARRGSDLSIEILGAQKVKEAVPVLEVVLNDESINRTVRGTALDSLWLITGKRYEIGK